MNIEDLRETAALAHLNLSEEELAGAFPAFEEMLGFFTAMQAADREFSSVEGAAPAESFARTLDSRRFREDLCAEGDGNPGGEGTVEQMLDSAGERDGRFVVVPNVL
jgi:aspartyl-tRNA(Asn)/glutamyl-tRNA(Gln) amidotransferase subunit C